MEESIQDRLLKLAGVLRFFGLTDYGNLLVAISKYLRSENIFGFDEVAQILYSTDVSKPAPTDSAGN